MTEQRRSSDGIVEPRRLHRTKFFELVQLRDRALAQLHGVDGVVALSEVHAPLSDHPGREELFRSFLAGVTMRSLLRESRHGFVKRDLDQILGDSVEALVSKVHDAASQSTLVLTKEKSPASMYTSDSDYSSFR